MWRFSCISCFERKLITLQYNTLAILSNHFLIAFKDSSYKKIKKIKTNNEKR